MCISHKPAQQGCFPHQSDAKASWVVRFFEFVACAHEAINRDQTRVIDTFAIDGRLTSRIRARVKEMQSTPMIELWPPNVLRSIARHLDILDCVHLSRVCSRIRSVLMGDSQPWNRVWIMDHFNSLNAKSWALSRTLMQRTAGYPSHLRITTSIHWFQVDSPQLKLLDDWLSAGGGVTLEVNLHAPFISWGISEPESFTTQTATILDLFEREGGVPSLQYMRLGIPQRTPHLSAENELSENFLGGFPGALTELWLDNVFLKIGTPYPALANVTAFCSSTIVFRTVDLGFIISLLKVMPLLEHLALSNLSITETTGADDVRQLVSKHPLRRVIISNATGCVAEFVGALAEVRHVAVLANHGSAVEPLCSIWPKEDLHMTIESRGMRLQSTKFSIGPSNESSTISENHHHEISFVRRPTRIGMAFRNSEIISIPIGHASRIVSLWMHEWQWASFVRETCNLPRLTELHIVLATCSETRGQTAQCGIFIARPRGPVQLSFIALERLHLYAHRRPGKDASQSRCMPYHVRHIGLMPYPSCGCDVGCTLALSDVRDFLECLLPQGQKLKTFVIAGVAAIVDINTPGRRSAIDDFSESIEIWEEAPSGALDRCMNETYPVEVASTLFGPRVQQLFAGRDPSSLSFWWTDAMTYE